MSDACRECGNPYADWSHRDEAWLCFGCYTGRPADPAELLDDAGNGAPTVQDLAELYRVDGATGGVSRFGTSSSSPSTGCQVPDPLGRWHLGTPSENGSTEPKPGVPTRGTPGTLEKVRLLDVERMLVEEPPPVPWVVNPLLVAGCVTMLAGREGQGKSMLALALAAAVGHGTDLAGLECNHGTVLYLDAENGEREAHRRIHGLGVKPHTLLYAEVQRFNLAADMTAVDDLVKERKPAVVVLDSLRSLAPGLDENDSKAAEAALRPVSRLAQTREVPILILHHAGKSGHEYRGSTAIGAAVELGFTLSRHEEDPDRETRRKLACWKCRPAREPKPRWLSIAEDGDRVLVGEAEPFHPQLAARDGAADELLAALNGRPTTWADWARDAGLDSKNGTARRARDSLVERGRVKQDDDGTWTAVT